MNKKEFTLFIIVMCFMGILLLVWSAKADEARTKMYEDCKPLLDINNKIQCQTK